MNDFINWLAGLFGNKPVPAPDPKDPCNAAACVDAKQRLTTARSRFNNICTALQVLKSVTDALTIVISTPVWILIALLAVILLCALVGGPVAGIISVFAVVMLAVWVISWLLLPVIGRMTAPLVQALTQAQMEFQAALKDVIINCPEKCRGDISIPQCNL